MSTEEKQLLFKDLCARLPYGVKINIKSDYTREMEDTELTPYHLDGLGYNAEYRNLRPYLRPMSSMTSQEWCELCDCEAEDEKAAIYIKDGRRFVSPANKETFLNSYHFDFRGLIPMGLALEAPEGMYKTE